jgi:hypothetical protein
MRSTLGVSGLVLLAITATASAEPARPRLERILRPYDGSRIANVVNTKTIFMNRCPNGCVITNGFTDSRTNKSAIAAGTLSAYSFGDDSWNAVMTCMKQTFSRFNVEITDVDPGPYVDHFEIMVAGSPTEVGLPSDVGGVAEYSCEQPGVCDPYQPNAIVFDFAKVWGGLSNRDLEICATAAQEIAHSWSLDHVTDKTDPMTYAQYTGMRQFKDNVTCGSDCVNGQSPFGLSCNSAGAHTCMSTGTATQNDVQTLLNLFGPAGAKAPTLTVTNPKNGSAQPAGFTITAQCSSDDGVQEVQMTVDGKLVKTLTAPPFTFQTSANLALGAHRVTVMCASKMLAETFYYSQIIIGPACATDGDCAAGGICYGSACIAGPDAAGGLGATCSVDNDCMNGRCASDGTMKACVIPCDISDSACPDGFGCIGDGAGGGVCWFGVDEGGCCDSSNQNPTGALLFGLGVGATLVTRRRRRKA